MCSQGMDILQNSLRKGPVNLGKKCLKMSKISVKIMNLLLNAYEKLEGRIDTCWSKPCWGKYPKRRLQGKLAHAPAICSSNDLTQLRTKEMYSL